MKKELILLSGLLVAFCSCLLVRKSAKPLYAENQSFIGTFYTAEKVSSQTKVYLNDVTMPWAIACNRDIYQEIGPLNGDNEIQSIGNNLNGAPNVVHYFYYATPYEPKITGTRALYNDLSSLLFVLEYLETIASTFNLSDSKNAILGYIRGINIDYTNSLTYFNNEIINVWNTVCGSYQSSLKTYVNEFYAGGGVKINEYFASFIHSSKYNYEYYGLCNSTYLTMNVCLVNPVSSLSGIDLIHMFASLDGLFEGTGSSTNNYTFGDTITENTFRYLVSWGGDLQFAAKSLQNSNVSSFDFCDVLQGDYGFDYHDFYADIDATNIATSVNLTNCDNLSDLIDDYYDDLLQNEFEREDLFIAKIASTANPDYSFLSDDGAFLYYSADILKIDGNLNNPIANFYDPLKYHLMFYFNDLHIPTGIVSFQYRYNLELAFLDYFGILLS